MKATVTKAAVLLTLVIGAALFAANAGRLLVVERLGKADAILVLDGNSEDRPERALELFRQGYAARVILDASADVRFYNRTEAELAQSYIDSLPTEVRSAYAVCPIHALSTEGEALEAGHCLGPVQSVLIVTSDYHSRRALSTFRRRLSEKAFGVAGSQNAREFGVDWWRRRQWAKHTLEEWERLMWWELVDRW